MSSDWTPEMDGHPVDWMDLADDQFVTGPRAWRAARAGRSDPERHLTAPGLDAPELRGWPLLARHVIHDLAALNKTEMLVWDAPPARAGDRRTREHRGHRGPPPG